MFYAYRDTCHKPWLRGLRQAGALAVIILASVIPCIAESHDGASPVGWPYRIHVLKAICAPAPSSKSVYIFNPAVQEHTASSILNVHFFLNGKRPIQPKCFRDNSLGWHVLIRSKGTGAFICHSLSGVATSIVPQ